MTVEVYHVGKRVASHRRSGRKGGHTTVADRMPKSHRKHLEWTPSRLAKWAGSIGPHTQALVKAILESRRHPEQGYRSVLGLLRLAKRYDNDRLEAASARAFKAGARSYRSVAAILKNGLDRVPLDVEAPQQGQLPFEHNNVRGADYYH